jgi:hypothetical protein
MPAAFATAQRIQPVHSERERISAAARRQAVLDDLDTLLVGPATPIGIATAPRTVNTDLCQRDAITLRYEHANDGNPRSPFKPIGIANVVSEYHLLGYSNELSESEARKACRSLDNAKDYWAYSDSESTARFGLITLKEVAAAVRANSAVTLDCTALQDAEITARCALEFLTVADHPSSVNDCSERPLVALHKCFVYDLGHYRVTITRSWPATGGGPTATVELEPQEIIV